SLWWPWLWQPCLLLRSFHRAAAGRTSSSAFSSADFCRTSNSSFSSAERPDFSGVWRLERAENLARFMRAIGYNFLVAQAAGLARVTQTIEQRQDEIKFVFEVVPPLLAQRSEALVKLGAEEVSMRDDAGREMLLLSPAWNGTVFSSGLRYLNPRHELTIDRYMEDGFMVEHVRYPSKALEMRRIFRKVG
ncbi:unnamed protein product, partial [Polarella glacialis]